MNCGCFSVTWEQSWSRELQYLGWILGGSGSEPSRTRRGTGQSGPKPNPTPGFGEGRGWDTLGLCQPDIARAAAHGQGGR